MTNKKMEKMSILSPENIKENRKKDTCTFRKNSLFSLLKFDLNLIILLAYREKKNKE